MHKNAATRHQNSVTSPKVQKTQQSLQSIIFINHEDVQTLVATYEVDVFKTKNQKEDACGDVFTLLKGVFTALAMKHVLVQVVTPIFAREVE